MLAKTHAAAVHGVDARTIEVEVNSGGEVAQGEPTYPFEELPDHAISEAWLANEKSTRRNPIDYPSGFQLCERTPKNLVDVVNFDILQMTAL